MAGDPLGNGPDDRAVMPSAGHALAADRLSRAPKPLAHLRRLVVPRPAAQEPHAADAHAYLRVIAEVNQRVPRGHPAAAPALALTGLPDRRLSLSAHGHSPLPGKL